MPPHEQAEGGSAHLLSPGQDRMLREDPAGASFEGATLGSFSSANDEVAATPVRMHVDELFCVSLSDGLGGPTRPRMIGGGPCSSCTSTGQRASLEELCGELKKALSPLLGSRPSAAKDGNRRWHRRKREPVSNPRRSVRLARGVGRGSFASKQQNVLIRRLCLANESEVISDEALQNYAKLFEQPLSDGHIRAILALFD